MLIGPDSAGRMLEIGVLDLDDYGAYEALVTWVRSTQHASDGMRMVSATAAASSGFGDDLPRAHPYPLAGVKSILHTITARRVAGVCGDTDGI